ncbi:hypothetical protein R3P38DRAFT_3199934 [Favolaschia claudopus]|uniref:Uncharacterized protein n=1 Tax=Favolaschia claudopus TaxID=2862362 RepID=A0AAW0B079_9AGAR
MLMRPLCRSSLLSLPSSLSVVHSLVLFGSLITPTNLTKLVLDSVGHDGEIYAVYLMDGLKSCVGLTHLHLIHLRTMDVPSRTILDHLSSCYFVTALQLPALTSLKFEGSGNRLQCLLGDKQTPHTIANVLPDFPGLRHLDIRSYETSDMAGVWQGVYLFTQHNSLCPRLEMIHVGCELTEDDVRSILRSRPLGHFASSCGIASYVWGPLGGLGVCQYKAIGGHVTMTTVGPAFLNILILTEVVKGVRYRVIVHEASDF